MKALAHFARQLGKPCVHTCNINWDIRILDCTRIKERRHQCDLVMLAAEVQLCAVLPRIPKCADDLDLLAQFPRHRLRPRNAEAPLNMRLHLSAQPQNESTAGLCRQVPCGVGKVGGGTRKRHGNGGAKVHAGRMFRDQCAGKEGIVLGLLSPQRGEACLLRGFRNGRNIFQCNWGEGGI